MIDYHCAGCDRSMFDTVLHRTSPIGENFVGKCADCLSAVRQPVDAEAEAIGQLLLDAAAHRILERPGTREALDRLA